MDHSETYYYNLPLYTQDLYLPDNHNQQQQQQQQPPPPPPPVVDQSIVDPLYTGQYRYRMFQQQQQQQLQHHHQTQRPHSHPQHTQQSYPYHTLPHDQLRHSHSHPALPRVSPPIQHPISPPHTSRSSPSTTSAYSPDPLSTLRDDFQVHAAAAALAQASGHAAASVGSSDLYASGVPRLPPILQVEKQQVTTTATQAASAIRRRNDASFRCPVPGCGSTFTRRFNLKGHLRSHTSERPYACEWPGCDKAFARQHDCKRHYGLHSAKAGTTNLCPGCGKSFSRTDALNRHCESPPTPLSSIRVLNIVYSLVRSEGGVDCRVHMQAVGGSSRDMLSGSPRGDSGSPSDTTDGTTSGPSRSRPPSV